MKHLKLTLIMCLAIAGISLTSCSKSNDTKPVTKSNLSLIQGDWYTSGWGGVDGNYFGFNLATGSTTALVTLVGNQPFNFAVGDQMFTGLTLQSNGSYTGMGKYTYGTNNASTGIRAVVITLQNSNTQMTADYPAINASFPEITYIFQKGTVTVLQ